MPRLASYQECTGCAACVNKCNRQALLMQADKTGFLFPVLQRDKCVDCGLCEKACPVLDKVSAIDAIPNYYIVQHKNESIRKESTSGGAFTAIAKYVIDNNGIVFGAAFDKGYVVKHIGVSDVELLKNFRSSKYVQSEIDKSFSEAEKYLKQNQLVCFSGTPCQIHGLKKYLGREYENLITVDFMCRAVPSPKILNKYIQYMQTLFPSFNRLIFRDKKRGYSYSTLALYDHQKNLYRGGSESNQWLRLFLGGYCNRLSCHECKFQSGYRVSDFTLWDCWNTHIYSHEWDDNKGTTNVIAWNEKAKKVLTYLNDELNIKNLDFSLVEPNLNRGKLGFPKNYNRELFFEDSDKLNPKTYINKYAPMTFTI